VLLCDNGFGPYIESELRGDIDRAALAAQRLQVWPERAPGVGHMGVLPSAVGPDAIVRLQSGGAFACRTCSLVLRHWKPPSTAGYVPYKQ
jgi:hypothetical protein